MKVKIDGSELKEVQIKILDIVSKFCQENNIKYWLDSGTLLGAVRHKGYIPWDDDIDIGMLRDDFNKFMILFNKSNDRYKFYCIENNDNFYFPYGKVLDTQTELYEPNEKDGIKICVNIDVFVYDNAPEELKKIKIMFKKRDLYRTLNSLQLFRSMGEKDKMLKNIIRMFANLTLKIFPRGYFCKKIVRNAKKFSKLNTNKVGNFSASAPVTCDKRVFFSFIEVEFEGKRYPAPIGYDEWLRAFYGDYMKFPPKEKQVSHHSFIAYKLENDNNLFI